jgi:hypothetical protein
MKGTGAMTCDVLIFIRVILQINVTGAIPVAQDSDLLYRLKGSSWMSKRS